MGICRGRIWLDLSEMKKAMLLDQERKSEILSRTEFNKAELSKYISLFERHMDSRGLSENTKKVYISVMEHFFSFFYQTKPSDITNAMLEEYISTEIVQKGFSRSYQKQVVSAVKSFYRDRKEMRIDLGLLPKIKKSSTLPKVLSSREIRGIIECTGNLKHRTILMMMYGCGLRVGEMLDLKLEDIHSDRFQIAIIQGKGYRDRVLPISLQILEKLRMYYKAYKPKHYLIEGTAPGKKYSRESISSFLKRSARKAGIEKRVHPHMLRHSFATHLLEAGVSLRYIQELLGHRSSRTTEIYTYVSQAKMQNIPNPYDFLDL
jgi:integrase/recombinase XerD